MRYEIVKANETNKSILYSLVSSHLETDYTQKDEPDEHFFHNLSLIQNSFNKTKALVALTHSKTLAGFCTFSYKITNTYLDIVYTTDSHRRKGILKQFLQNLIQLYPSSPLFSANVIAKSQHIFENFGFNKYSYQFHTVHIKTISPSCKALTHNPKKGIVFALNPNDYYAVSSQSYNNSFTFYQPEVNANNLQLLQPICAELNKDDYIHIELDGKVICKGKSKYLFKDNAVYYCNGFTSISFLHLQNNTDQNTFRKSLRKRLASDTYDSKAPKRLRLMPNPMDKTKPQIADSKTASSIQKIR